MPRLSFGMHYRRSGRRMRRPYEGNLEPPKEKTRCGDRPGFGWLRHSSQGCVFLLESRYIVEEFFRSFAPSTQGPSKRRMVHAKERRRQASPGSRRAVRSSRMSLRSCGLRGMIAGVRTEKSKRYSTERYGMQTGNAAIFVPVIPAERAGLRPASESRIPVTKVVRALTPAVDCWVPARSSPVEPGSLGRDDSPYAIAAAQGGGEYTECAARLLALLTAGLFTVVGLPALAQAPKIGDPPEAKNMRLVGFNDLQGRSAYQPIIHRQGDRYIAYIGHHGGTESVPKPLNPLTHQNEFNGTSIVDVTDPKQPKYLAHIPAQEGLGEQGGAQMVRACDGKCLPKGDPSKTYLLRTFGSQGHEMWDVSKPESPSLITRVSWNLKDTHKSWWECDTGLAYLVSGVDG